MFQGSVFLVISSERFQGAEVKEIVSILEQNGGKVFIKEEYNNDVNYLNESQDTKRPPITHVICNSIQFIEYSLAQNSMIPITSPDWVFDSIQKCKISNPKVFNPDPNLFLRDTFVCVADNLPVGDKEAIYGGVRAFGGQYLDDLTRYTTHLIAMDMNNDKSIIAASAISGPADGEAKAIDIKIVLPHWIDDCLKMGKKLAEGPYLLPSLGMNETEDAARSPVITEDDTLPEDSSKSGFFDNKLFYISPDYKISERLTGAICTLITKHGGKVTIRFDLESVDIYIGHYRLGEEYVAACRTDRIIVGNLQWLYSIIVTNKWVLPTNSNLLHYPIPANPLPDFQNLKISVTNYSGDARFYLSKLITILGGTFTKTLTRENDFLIAAKPEGKKYEAAKVKWRSDEKNIKVVNHIWLEECFANWKLVNHDKPKFQFLGNNAKGMENLLCKIKLKQNVLHEWYKEENITEREDVADSMSEDESSAQPRRDMAVEELVKKTAKKSQVAAKNRENNTLVHDTPAEPVAGRSGRSAKQKAVSKLHSDMNDLNDYQQMSKSSRKMKSYMEELEKTGKRKPEADDQDNKTEGKKRKTAIESAKPDTDIKIVAIITGCENEITLSRHDTQRLNHIGIKVLSDYSTKQGINTLIAPRILRTAKFLRSLSQVDKIVHPNYLIDILKKLNSSPDTSGEQISKEYRISDYSLDKVVPAKTLNEELGVTNPKENGLSTLLNTTNRGTIFQNLRINLSTNVVGGTQVISEILESHGLQEAKSVKSITAATTKSMLEGDDGRVILIAHKTRDSKMIGSFKKNLPEGIVVEWDWCVKSIFKMKLEDFDAYRL